MFETSLQAKFVIPMAVALGFAVMFATLITLVLVPCLYIVMSDVGNGFLNVFRAGHRVATRRKLARD